MAWVAWDAMIRPKDQGGLGFRDLELFNLALLAKQAWRLLQDPHSLSARVLKAVYFPDDDFLEATLGSNPSRVWRSVMDGREVLREGLIRRIGTGEDTPIWTMNWLPSGNMRRPVKVSKPNLPVMVSELIDSSEARWDMEKLSQFFTPADVVTITGIPICTRRQADYWAWHHDRRGMFTVRSAYYMLVHKKDQNSAEINAEAGCSDSATAKKEWKQLWSIRVPSKIRIFLWRLAKCSLPSMDVLKHRHIAESSNCSLCGMEDSWRHSLVDCSMARCVWALEDDGIGECISSVDEDNARLWLSEVLEALSAEEGRRVAVTLWAIWYARRQAIHEKKFQSPLSTHSFVDRFMSDIREDKQVQRKSGSAARQSLPWIPPPPGVVKINVDAALSKNDLKATAGAIARDATGRFLGASALVVQGIDDPEIMEVMACREGLALALDIQASNIKLACDCLSAVKAITEGSMGVSGQIIREITAARRDFSNSVIVHEGRASNGDAHTIARNAIYESSGRHVWFLAPPLGVCNSYPPA